jgi:hypothetical protein
MYLPITLNHFRAIKSWTDSCDAQVTLDIKTFALEVKFRHRYYTLKPRFLNSNNGRMGYTTELGEDTGGFIGWLPYDILQWDLSKNKLVFKDFLKITGVKFPASWSAIGDVDRDFLVKGSAGSFGYQLAGPYQKFAAPFISYGQRREEGPSADFLEEFVAGTNLKVWFWGAQAIHAHVHPYPTIVGDGRSTVQFLVESRLARAGTLYSGKDDQESLASCLKFQGFQLSDVLEHGREVWIDFRYGRRYEPVVATHKSDNDLARVDTQVRKQIDQIGVTVADEAFRRFKAPVLYSVDGVVDAAGMVWWLEVNSNPMLPPEGYRFIFMSLFGSAKKL